MLTVLSWICVGIRRRRALCLLLSALKIGRYRADLTFLRPLFAFRTWGGQFWPSDRDVFSWTDGAPPNVVAGDTVWQRGELSPRAGVTSARGRFGLTIAAAAGTGTGTGATTRKLTLFLGLFNYGGFGNKATLTLMSPGSGAGVGTGAEPGAADTIERVIEHDYGANNNWLNTKATVVFNGTLEVGWELSYSDPRNKRPGLVSLQAATLEESDDSVIGGVILRNIEIDPPR